MKTAIAARVALALVALSVLSMSQAGDLQPATSPSTSGPVQVDGTYEGAWVTAKTRKLNGTASCEVKQLSNGRWQGRFSGQWQQMPFEYTVQFSADNGAKQTRLVVADANAGKLGPIPVIGKATIDGARYEFVGELSAREFTIQFTGDRYEGAVLLNRVQDKKPVPSGGN
jgi:hypothetical protein